MKTEVIYSLTKTFEEFAQRTESGVEFWLARDLQHLLGYTKWDNFVSVVAKAKTACEVSGYHVAHHFADVGKTILMPKGATKEVPDVMLTRYAVIYEQTGSIEDFALIRSKGDRALFNQSTQKI